MPLYFIYPIYTGILGLILCAVVPKKDIQRLAVYGLISGGVLDAVVIILFTHILGVGGYINYGPFGFMGMPFFPLLAWTIFFILFFYFIPEKKPWNYIFVLIAALYSVLFSNMLMNLGIFKWNYDRLIIPFLIYISWFSAVTWGFYRVAKKN